MQTIYTYEDRTFYDWHAWNAHKTQCEAQSAAFHEQFGRPGERNEAHVRATVAAVRAAEPKSSSYAVPPLQPKYQGGLTEAQVDRFAANGATGVQHARDPNRMSFAVPSGGAPMEVPESLPPGMKRVNFFSGV